VTSSFGATECFVYLMLPGATSFVTAARFVLEPDRSGVPLGRFVYAKSYLARPEAVPIDPVELKLGARTYENRRLKGVFGALRDASPDYWGRRVIERHSGKATLAEIDYLLYSPDDRAGALGFGLGSDPPAPRSDFNRTLDLERVQAIADRVIADEESPVGADARQLQELLLVGTSMGGARPKTVVEDDDALWIAKFNRPDDEWNSARVEHATLLLAKECGLEVALSRVDKVGDRDALLVRRFDREKTATGYRRARMLSALTLLRSGDTYTERDRWSYMLLVEELRRLSAQAKLDAPELFRRMTFNALVSNIDDHPRNHAVIALDADWRLSPAYDLTPTKQISLARRDLAMECGDYGRAAQAGNLMSQCARFLLERDAAQRIVDDMEQTVKTRWYEVARRAGVSEQDCTRIAPSFAYPGFRYATPASPP
jgi:serine/threonine-protein kinase HipA